VEKDPNSHGLKRETVARACVRAVDGGERTVWMPRYMGLAPPLFWLVPGFVEWRARLKYNFDLVESSDSSMNLKA
jgi:hypothetical protein